MKRKVIAILLAVFMVVGYMPTMMGTVLAETAGEESEGPDTCDFSINAFGGYLSYVDENGELIGDTEQEENGCTLDFGQTVASQMSRLHSEAKGFGDPSGNDELGDFEGWYKVVRVDDGSFGIERDGGEEPKLVLFETADLNEYNVERDYIRFVAKWENITDDEYINRLEVNNGPVDPEGPTGPVVDCMVKVGDREPLYGEIAHECPWEFQCDLGSSLELSVDLSSIDGVSAVEWRLLGVDSEGEAVNELLKSEETPSDTTTCVIDSVDFVAQDGGLYECSVQTTSGSYPLAFRFAPRENVAGPGGGEDEWIWGDVYGSDHPQILEIDGAEYYTYLCEEGEEVYLTPSGIGGDFVWEKRVGDEWVRINVANDDGNQYISVTKDSSQEEYVRCRVMDSDRVFNYLLYKYTLVTDTPDAEGEIKIVGKEKYLDLMSSSFVNGSLYDEIPSIVLDGQNAILTIDISLVDDIEADAKAAFAEVGESENHVTYYTISVDKKVTVDVEGEDGNVIKEWPAEAETVYCQNENIQAPSFRMPMPKLEEPAEDVVIRVINFYNAILEENENGSEWDAFIMESVEVDGNYYIPVHDYSGYYEVKYADRDEVYYYEEMMTNMGLAEYHCRSGFLDPAENAAYYNDFNRAMWYCIYAETPKDYTDMQFDETVYALTVEQLYDMISSLFDPRFDEENMMGLKSATREEALEVLEKTVLEYVPEIDDEEGFMQFHRELDWDGNLIVVIDTELHFGDPDHVKFRMADLPDVNKENEVLLMGMFVHPVDLYKPYSDTPRLITVDGSNYELLSSPELLINEENDTRKIISFDMFDYLIETLENNEQQVSISPTVETGDKPSMYEEITVSTTIKDFQKLKALKLQAKAVENPNEAKNAISETGVEVEGVFSNDITLTDADGNVIKNIDVLGLENNSLEVRIKIPSDWLEGLSAEEIKAKLENVRAYYITEKDDEGDRAAELLYGELKEINGEWYYVLFTDHFSEYTIALLSDESINDLEDVPNPNAPNQGEDGGTTPGGPDDPTGGNGEQPPVGGNGTGFGDAVNGGSAADADNVDNADKATKTGDDFNAALPIALAGFAVIAMAVAVFARKKFN